MERKKYKISGEVFKFPYNGNCENNETFSEKFCYCTIKVHKKIKKGIEANITCLELILNVANGISTSRVLPVFPTSAPKMRVTQSRPKFASVIHN